jgi:hypothetical protein
MAKTSEPSTDIVPVSGAVINRLLRGELDLPAELTKVIDMQGWARSLITHEDYNEPDKDYLQRTLLLQTLSAESLEDVFRQGAVRKLQESVPNVPGGTTGPVDIYDLYVTDSDFGEGAPCYMLLGCRDLETGIEARYSTGAQQLQAQVMASICLGTWPIRCRITRTDRKDRGGRFLFWLFPPDGQ